MDKNWKVTRYEREGTAGTYYICRSLGVWKAFFLGESASEPSELEPSSNFDAAKVICERHEARHTVLIAIAPEVTL